MAYSGLERRVGLPTRRVGLSDRRVTPTQYDMLTWLLPDPTVMSGKHLTGNANPMYGVMGKGVVINGVSYSDFYWCKGNKGWPADRELFDANYVYHWLTELDWTSSSDYKKTAHDVTIPLCKRYMADGDFVLSTNSNIAVVQGCKLVKTFMLGDVRCELHNVGVQNLGGTIGQVVVLEIRYRWGGSGHTTGVYNTQETYSLAKPYGLVGWKTQKWNGTNYDPPTQTVVFNTVTTGTVVPDFPTCTNL